MAPASRLATIRRAHACQTRGARSAAVMAVRIAFSSSDGEEREEEWASVERFRSWAVAERLDGYFTAYEADDDGEWVVVAKGRVGGTR